jgi:hypothetical protein
LKQEFYSEDGDSLQSDDDDDNTTLRSDDDDNLSFADTRSRASSDGGGDSAAAVQKKKKKKGGLWRKRRQKMFGGTIQEGNDEDEFAEINARRTRASSSQDGSEDYGVAQENGAPAVGRTRARRRGSLGGLFSNKETTPKSHSSVSDDDLVSKDLGYEDAEPSVPQETTRGRPQRRGSLGSMFVRRGSLTGRKDQEEEQPKPEPRRRRHSLVGSSSDRIASSLEGTKSTVDDMAGLSLHSAATGPTSRSKYSKPTKSRSMDKPIVVSVKDKDMFWLINQERVARKMKPFARNILLDTLAKSMANEIVVGMQPTPTAYYGNVGCGKSIEHIHSTIMADIKGVSRRNILSDTFSDFGAAVVVGRDRQLYMVTLFH